MSDLSTGLWTPYLAFHWFSQKSTRIVTLHSPNQHALLTTTPDPWEEATILATLSALPSSPKIAPNLKFIHLFSAGSDHVQKTPIYKGSNIPITTSSGIHGPQIAEWVIMEILCHSHKEKQLIEWQKEHKWGSHKDIKWVKDSVGQRLGVLGYGSIGRQSECFPRL